MRIKAYPRAGDMNGPPEIAPPITPASSGASRYNCCGAEQIHGLPDVAANGHAFGTITVTVTRDRSSVHKSFGRHEVFYVVQLLKQSIYDNQGLNQLLHPSVFRAACRPEFCVFGRTKPNVSDISPYSSAAYLAGRRVPSTQEMRSPRLQT